jgi:transposase
VLLKLILSTKGAEKVSDLLLMSQRELTRLEVIQRVRGRRLTQRQAADLLGLSIRQVKRLSRAYRQGGARALQSKHRGRPSNNRLPPGVVSRARELLRERYYDFGPTLAHEKLVEAHGLRLSVESVRRLMMAEGLWQPRRARCRVVHPLRERRARLGELVQIDGSPHDWFEGRGPRCVLLNFVDDATGRLMHLSFVGAETTFSYFAAVRSYVTCHGKPRALYSDKLGVFRVNMPNALGGAGLTQFGRAMAELSIELICAHSPQAKGRVERANQTLQDRLVKELRLRAISSAAQANAYLPEFIADYNSRFAVAARSAEDAHRPLGAGEDLDRILVLCEGRTLSRNLTLSYNGRIYQIETRRAPYTMRGARVEVREASAGEVRIEYRGRPLSYRVLAEREKGQGRVAGPKALDAGPTPRWPRRVYRPPAAHPWRFFDYSEQSMAAREKRGELCILRR